MQDPVKIVLGTKRTAQGYGSKRRVVEKDEVFMYIPILQTLQVLLSNETVLSEVIQLYSCQYEICYMCSRAEPKLCIDLILLLPYYF